MKSGYESLPQAARYRGEICLDLNYTPVFCDREGDRLRHTSHPTVPASGASRGCRRPRCSRLGARRRPPGSTRPCPVKVTDMRIGSCHGPAPPPSRRTPRQRPRPPRGLSARHGMWLTGRSQVVRTALSTGASQWVEVQQGRYRCTSAIYLDGFSVSRVIREYLACEVWWDKPRVGIR